MIGVILTLLIAPWFVKIYWAKPIEGWVVDAETGQPLEDVNVVAHWALEFGIEGGSQSDLVLTETVTDKNGRYYFAGWGPMKVPWRMPFEARLQNFDPEIIFFKDGYEWQAVFNDRAGKPGSGVGAWVRDSVWDGKQIRLKRFTGAPREYGSFTTGVLTGVSWGKCGWTQIPRMMLALDKVATRLSAERVPHYLPTVQRLENTAEGQECLPVREILTRTKKDEKTNSLPDHIPRP